MLLVQSLRRLILVSLWFLGLNQHLLQVNGEDCRITPVLHVLQSPGCNPLTIPSFACVGKCTSYVQVSKKMWSDPCSNSVRSIFYFICSICSNCWFWLLIVTFQVSGSKMWQTERSCMCCQESGEREATVTLSCPKAPPGSPKSQKVCENYCLLSYK